MKRAFAASLVFSLCACTPALWERTERTGAGRLYVPRVFAPLVPGSIYPDRARPVPAKGLPAVLAVPHRLSANAIAGPLGRRGLVALVAKPGAPLGAALERLRASAEAGGTLGLFLEDPSPALLAEALARADVAAVVVAGEAGVLPAAHPPLLVLRTGVPSGPALEDAAERWYAAPSGALPAEAREEAADWLAERLHAR